MEQGAIAGSGQPVMGTDATGAARFLRTDASGNLATAASGGSAPASTPAAGTPIMGTDAGGLARFVRTDANGNLSAGPYPAGATPIAASATGTTAATTATLAGAAAKTTYIAGFSIDSDAGAAIAGNATVTGVVGGTQTYRQGVGVSPAIASLSRTFDPPIPASAVNTAIVVASLAAGAGGNTTVNVWGYQL